MKPSEDKLFDFENLFLQDRKVLDFIRLFQISEVALDFNGQIEEHVQTSYEISYIISGGGKFYTQNTEFKVGCADIHIVAKGDKHKIVVDDTDRLRYICLGFEFTNICEQIRPVCEFYLNSSGLVCKADDEVRHLFEMLINEYYNDDCFKEFSAECIVKLILIKVFKLFTPNIPKNAAKKGLKIGNPTVMKIIKYIDSNIYEVGSVRGIALKLNFSENYISHIFKANMGITLLSYIRKKKMQTVKSLIEDNKVSVKEISELLHFDSPQSLSRAFKKEYGKSPTQYRNEIKKTSYAD